MNVVPFRSPEEAYRAQARQMAAEQSVLGKLGSFGRSYGDTLNDVIGMLASGVGEIPAGLAGIASLPFGLDTAADNVQAVRDALTWQPRSGGGEQAQRMLGELLQPVAEAEEALGNFGYDLAGPAGGTIAKTLPTAIAAGLPFVPKGAMTNAARAMVPSEMPQVKGFWGDLLAPGLAQKNIAGDVPYGDYQVPLKPLNPNDGTPMVVSGQTPEIRQPGQKERAQLAGDDMSVRYDQWKKTPAADDVAQKLRQDPTVKTTRLRNTESILDAARDQFANNLEFVRGQADPAMANRYLQWYPGANRIAQGLSDAYGMPLENAAFGIAAYSPKTAWDVNVEQALRTAHILHNQKGIPMTDDMKLAFQQGLLPGKVMERQANIWDKRLDDLQDPRDIAAWVSAMDKGHYPATYGGRNIEGSVTGAMMTPTGRIDPYTQNTISASSNAIRAFQAPNFDAAQAALGGAPKVRSFGANIVDPYDPRFATIDTHQVAGSYLLPLGANSGQARQAFGGGITPGAAAKEGLDYLPYLDTITKRDSLGYSGTQPLHQAAVEEAARRAGTIPRGEQSVTWTIGRERMDGKKTAANKQAAKDIWTDFAKGRISQEEAQRRVWALFN